MTRQPNTSPLPALKAAVEAFRQSRRQAAQCSRSRSWTQTLETFHGCTYTLTFSANTEERNVAVAPPLPLEKRTPNAVGVGAASRSSSSSSTSDRREINTRQDAEDVDGAMMRVKPPTDVDTCHCAAAISLNFTHGISFAQLNVFCNVEQELVKRLQFVAPHCTCAVPSPPPHSTSAIERFLVVLDIPLGVTADERAAALVWAASLPVVTLVPVLTSFLSRTQAAGERQTLALLPEDDSLRSGAHAAVPSTSSSASTPAWILCATSTPSSSPPHVNGASPIFDGAVSITTCITSHSDKEAVLLRSYLDAFAAADATAAHHTPFVVHESPQPPPELRLPSVPAAALSNRPYVWWCTMMLGSHHLRTPDALESAVARSLRLRPTLLFHVHQESVSMHAVLRQQLASCAAQFNQ